MSGGVSRDVVEQLKPTLQLPRCRSVAHVQLWRPWLRRNQGQKCVGATCYSVPGRVGACRVQACGRGGEMEVYGHGPDEGSSAANIRSAQNCLCHSIFWTGAGRTSVRGSTCAVAVVA
jgi:hypothetical protein